ncbi:hypothetical protein K737_300924 [Holospora undulata HU1]|uniref:Uncharacterized protein n=3 Tax=Holospora TaxID=44747 RepID=A0A061JHA7_9PROT|nr:hypothetical protein [Holospora elegans]ETZ04667.1 hypothetical protein K737_300924 [Holospora undulata HU1]GAJ45854.1 hypothetical protein HE1_00164 [Holospora elegans E1]
MQKIYQYLATAFVVFFSFLCFFSPSSFWGQWILLGLVFPFAAVLLNVQLEISLLLSVFAFSSLALAEYPVAILVAYVVYFVIPLMLLRHQKSFKNEIPEDVFLKFFSCIMMGATFFVGLWWQDVMVQVSAPLLLKMWPGVLSLLSGACCGVWFLKDQFSLKKMYAVSMWNYWILSAFLMLAIALEDAQVVFCNMALSATLPFVLEGWSFLRSLWKNRSGLVFFIIGCCASISGVPLVILGLCSIFRPWIMPLLNEKE